MRPYFSLSSSSCLCSLSSHLNVLTISPPVRGMLKKLALDAFRFFFINSVAVVHELLSLVVFVQHCFDYRQYYLYDHQSTVLIVIVVLFSAIMSEENAPPPPPPPPIFLEYFPNTVYTFIPSKQRLPSNYSMKRSQRGLFQENILSASILLRL